MQTDHTRRQAEQCTPHRTTVCSRGGYQSRCGTDVLHRGDHLHEQRLVLVDEPQAHSTQPKARQYQQMRTVRANWQ
ncbi:hypothetical protein D9M69_599400 [compost metagenome]